MSTNSFLTVLKSMANFSDDLGDLEDLHKDVESGLYVCRKKILREPERPHCHIMGKRRMIVLAGGGWLILNQVGQRIAACRDAVKIFPGSYHCVIPGEEMVVWEIIPKHCLGRDTFLLRENVPTDFFNRGVEKRILITEFYRQVINIPNPTDENIINFSGPPIEEIRSQLRF